MRLLSDPAASYDPRIEKLFTSEELAYLKILNHSAFDNLSQVALRLQDSGGSAELSFEEDDSADAGAEVETKLYELISEIEHRAQQSLALEGAGIEDFTVQDFLVSLLSKFSKETRLSEIRFSDLIQIFLELQSLNQPKA